jgi:hypothetical protein
MSQINFNHLKEKEEEEEKKEEGSQCVGLRDEKFKPSFILN